MRPTTICCRLAVMAALAVSVPEATAQQASVYQAGFERDVNRYRWTGGLDVAGRSGAWDLAIANRFRSDAFLLFDDRLSFRDENALLVSARRALTRRADLRLSARSDWFSLSRVSSHTLIAGLAFAPATGITVEPMAGVAVDRRPGAITPEGIVPLRADAGPAVGLSVGMPRRSVDQYFLSVDGSAFWHRIEPRRSGGARIEAQADRMFESTRVRAEVEAASVRRDAYQAASFLNRDEAVGRSAESIESTRSDTLRTGVSVQTPLGRTIRLDGAVEFGANNRFVRTLQAPDGALFFDSDFNRRSADVTGAVAWRSGPAEVRLGVEAGAETERRGLANEADLPGAQAAQKADLLRQADFDRAFLTVRLDGRVPMGPRVVLQWDGSVNGIRHDTPLINLDDRDEVFYNGRLGALLRATRTVDVDLQVFGTFYHTVYLKAARSAENNVQRSLRLRPAFRWRPRTGTRVELASEVRATYTVDDFVLPGRRPTDQSARELRYDLSVGHDVSPGVRVLLDARRSDLRLGRFLNDVFAEIPFDSLATTGFWLRVQVGRRTTAEVGLRTFVRSDYDRSATVRYDRVDEAGDPVLDGSGRPVPTTVTRPGRERIAQIGPTCSVVIPMRNGSSLRFEGWYIVQRITHRLYGDLPESSADAIRRASDRGQRTVMPNLSVSWTWGL